MKWFKRAAVAALLAGLATPAFAADGFSSTPTTFSISGAGVVNASAIFIPDTTAPFHLVVNDLAGVSATCQVERNVDKAHWSLYGLWVAGSYTQMEVMALTGSGKSYSEDISEPQSGVQYRVNCTTYAAGPVTGQFSQR